MSEEGISAPAHIGNYLEHIFLGGVPIEAAGRFLNVQSREITN